MKKSRQSHIRKHLLFPVFLGILFAGIIIPGQFAQAQEKFVPGEVIVHFKPGIIDFPVGSAACSALPYRTIP